MIGRGPLSGAGGLVDSISGSPLLDDLPDLDQDLADEARGSA